jgi:diguanylate cyclase (GGDEF)-like protein
MKLSQKVIAFIGIPWISFLSITVFTSVNSSLFIYLTLATLCALTIFLLIHTFIIKRIKNLILDAQPYTIQEDEITAAENYLATLKNTATQAILELQQLKQDNLSSNFASAANLNKTIPLQVSTLVPSETNQEITQTNSDSLTQLAHYDNLTSLPNRVFFNEILNKAISHARRRNKYLAILLIDIDDFKNVNSNFSVKAGDNILKEFSKRLASSLRTEDVAARLEGDEFIVLLSDIGKPKFASAVAEKLLKNCCQAYNIEAQEIALTASIGISIYPNDGMSLENLFENADKALYRAKQMGGGYYQFYAREMDAEAREYIQLESALRKAIQNNELALYYQPKIQIKKGDIIGVEALLRWVHPALGIISPDKFIPLAEESGLISQIGEWAIREACKTSKYWHDEGYEHTTIAVNLSAKQFHDPKIAETIATILYETGLNPRYLELEITETAVMHDAEAALKILETIKSTGVRISLDHFGTGYTSISHLKKFPISALKIDHSFIKGIPNNPNDTAIASAVIALAHNLGLEVIAEGVETAEQVQSLGIMGCDVVQGYFLSHPLPAQKIMLQFKKLIDSVII